MLVLPQPLTPRHGRGRCMGSEWVITANQSWWGRASSSLSFPKDLFLPLPLLRLFAISNGLPCPASSFHPSLCHSSSQPLVKCLGMWAPRRPGKPRSYSAPPLSTKCIWCLFFFFLKLCSMWDLSSQIRNLTLVPCLGRSES